MASNAFKGGEKLQAHIRGMAQKLSAGKTLRVGFLETAKYPNGTNVAQVAFWNEYGTQDIPPRPFFRTLIAEKSSSWGRNLGVALTETNNDTTKALLKVGAHINDQLTNSIRNFSSPGNAPSTIAKKGFDKPLLDTGFMESEKGHSFDIQEGES